VTGSGAIPTPRVAGDDDRALGVAPRRLAGA
jgi:hypothetical protein